MCGTVSESWTPGQRDAPAVRKPRKAQSAKDRRYDEMKDTIKNLKNAQAINDWNAISSEFQKINQQIAKAQQLIATEGVPSFYIAAMAKLADLVENTVKDKVGFQPCLTTKATKALSR
jgi:translation initiation factor 3 subunit C